MGLSAKKDMYIHTYKMFMFSQSLSPLPKMYIDHRLNWFRAIFKVKHSLE